MAARQGRSFLFKRIIKTQYLGSARTDTYTDTMGCTDTLALTIKLGISDPVSLVDTKILTYKSITQESLGLVDSRIYEWSIIVTDNTGSSDGLFVKPTPADILNLTDSAGLGFQFSPAIPTATTGLLDTRRYQQYKVLTDSAGLTDTKVLVQAPGALDRMTLTDEVFVTITTSALVILDSASLNDLCLPSLKRPISDNMGLTDSAGLNVASFINSVALTDTFDITEVTNRVVVYYRKYVLIPN